MGDPAGIGPEIILQALAHRDLFDRCRPLVIGDPRLLERAAPGRAAESNVRDDRIPAGRSLSPRNRPGSEGGVGRPGRGAGWRRERRGGRAAVEAGAFAACDLTTAGEADAVVTAPLNKAAMHLAGFRYPGHTELLAERTGAGKITMLTGQTCASSTSRCTSA